MREDVVYLACYRSAGSAEGVRAEEQAALPIPFVGVEPVVLAYSLGAKVAVVLDSVKGAAGCSLG
jgi:hypothetical protein